jgi:hypothetical protein
MRHLLEQLEETSIQLKDSKFTLQKRGGGSKKSEFHWLYQFDVYNHSMRHRSQSGYELDHPGTQRHNVKSLALKGIRVRLLSQEETLKQLGGKKLQIDLQAGAWCLVEKIIDEIIPPVKEWAGQNLDYKVQFLMMANLSHIVKPHADSDEIAPQHSICLGNKHAGGELLTWDHGKKLDQDPHISTDVHNKLPFFDCRLKHAVHVWKGEHRI